MSESDPASPEWPLGVPGGAEWRVNAQTVDLSRPPRQPDPLAIAAQPQSVILDVHKTAVIIVDMQNDFCHAHGWLAHIGVDHTPARAPIEPLQRLLPVARSLGMPVLWVNWGNRVDRRNLSPAHRHVYNPDGVSVGLGDPVPASGAPVLERGSWGAAIVDELTPEPTDIHVAKYRMSGFWDTELDSILRNAGVTTLLFAGVNADQCVLFTLADANFLGYDTLLLSDCTATTNPAYCMDTTVLNIKQIFGFVTDSGALIHAASTREE